MRILVTTRLLLALTWRMPSAKALLSRACRNQSRRASHVSVTWRWGSPAVAAQPTRLRSIPSASSQTRLKQSRSATSELTVAREHLGNLFAGRNFLFTTRKNIREYEWGDRHTEDLFESILDLSEEKAGPLELSTIVVMETQTKKDIGKNAKLYDLHDGQQRLATLCLLLAALRDYFHRAGVVEEARIAQNMIYPPMRRREDVARVELNGTKDNLFRSILSNKMDSVNTLSPTERKALPIDQQLLLNAYDYFTYRLDELKDHGRVIEFFDNLKDDVFLLVGVTSDTKMARNIVMGQGKGKNMEPVDELKGIVCFNSIDDETEQDNLLQEWNQLCNDQSRDRISNACMLLAQLEMPQRRLRKHGEIDFFEDYMTLYCRGGLDGRHFYEKELKPTVSLLERLEGDSFSFSEDAGQVKVLPSATFLYAATKIQTAKDVALPLVFLIGEYTKASELEVRKSMINYLAELEKLALWMMLAKPKPKDRRQRCLEAIKYVQDRSAQRSNPFMLQNEEIDVIKQRLRTGEYGKGAPSRVGKAVLERLNEFELANKNQAELTPFHKTLQLEHVLPQKWQNVKYWSERWNDDDANTWLNRLGNLALLNQKVNAKVSNGSFDLKRKEYMSPYPLTQLITGYSDWSPKEVEGNHSRIIDLAIKVWKL